MAEIHLTQLDPNEHRDVKIAAALVGMSMKDFIILAVREKIKRDGITIPQVIPISVNVEVR